jgi:hypothetical protein
MESNFGLGKFRVSSTHGKGVKQKWSSLLSLSYLWHWLLALNRKIGASFKIRVDLQVSTWTPAITEFWPATGHCGAKSGQ